MTRDKPDKCAYNEVMNVIWDEAKAKRNPKAHDGVTFEEAKTALFDPYAVTREDVDARAEARFVSLARSEIGRVLIVVWTQREEAVIRIISAWKASSKQRNQYERQFI